MHQARLPARAERAPGGAANGRASGFPGWGDGVPGVLHLSCATSHRPCIAQAPYHGLYGPGYCLPHPRHAIGHGPAPIRVASAGAVHDHRETGGLMGEWSCQGPATMAPTGW